MHCYHVLTLALDRLSCTISNQSSNDIFNILDTVNSFLSAKRLLYNDLRLSIEEAVCCQRSLLTMSNGENDKVMAYK